MAFLLLLLLWPQAAAATAGVAMVNGEVITADRLAEEVAKEMASYNRHVDPTARAALERTVRRQALDRLIDHLLLFQASRKLEIEDLEQRARDELAKFKAGFPSAEAFAAYLKMRRWQENDLLAAYQRKIRITTYLQQQGLADYEPSESELRAFYEQGKEAYKRPERIRVRHILLRLEPDAGDDARRAALKRAEELRARLAAGEDFAGLAKEYSQCNTGAGGGELGWVERGFMPPEFDRVAFALQPGAIGGPVVTRFGVHLLQVEERQEAGITPFEEMRDFLRTYFIRYRNPNQEKIAAHLRHLRAQARVEIHLEEDPGPGPEAGAGRANPKERGRGES